MAYLKNGKELKPKPGNEEECFLGYWRRKHVASSCVFSFTLFNFFFFFFICERQRENKKTANMDGTEEVK